MKLKPCGYNVLVKPFNEDRMYGSVHLPDTAHQRAHDGVVIATGEWVDPEQIKAGDWVVFSNRQAIDVMHEDEPHYMLDQRAILVVVEDEIA